jgi:surface antigen
MFKIRPSTAAIYIGLFAVVITMVSIGYNKPQSSVVSSAVNISSSSQIDQTSVNNVVATSVAADVAQTTNLPIVNNVANLAMSAQISSELTQLSETSVTKPQIIESSVVNRSVISYTVKDGDTIDSIAAQFGITKQTIKWANDLVYDTLSVGKVLKILPIDGVLYTVKDGDTIDSISTKYSVDKTRLTLYNDLDVSGLTPNTSIILPSATLPTDEQPGYTAPVSSSSYYFRSGSTGNLYAIGNCTWYAYERRMQLGNPVGSYWGNANTWAIAASNTGYLVNHVPSAGAVLVDESGWAGHVAVVESVEPDGDIIISEMNNYAYGGWNKVNNRTISAGQAVLYKYIH